MKTDHADDGNGAKPVDIGAIQPGSLPLTTPEGPSQTFIQANAKAHSAEFCPMVPPMRATYRYQKAAN